MQPLVDVGRAQVSRSADGTVTVDDPDSPLVVHVQVGTQTGQARITRLCVAVRHRDGRIGGTALSRLPLAQIAHLAATRGGPAATHPNEALYRQLATPRPHGQRHWDDGHWARVMAVYTWARTSGRPGGGVQAVADMWGVSRSPTAYRWLAAARRRAAGLRQTGPGLGAEP